MHPAGGEWFAVRLNSFPMKRVQDPRSILVVLPTWVGDFVMATPALGAIRQRFAGAHITFLIEPNLRALAAGGKWMDECVEWPRKKHRSPLHKEYRDLVWDLRRRRFDWAVLFPNSFRSALFVRLVGAARRVGYARDGRGFLLTDKIQESRNQKVKKSKRDKVKTAKHVRTEPVPLVEYYADLAEALDCDRPGDRLELATTPECEEAVEARLAALGLADHRPLVVVSPGARYGAAKCWIPERFAAVADRLIETEGAAVIVTCGPGEEEIARQIGAAMNRKGFVLDDPRIPLDQLKSLIRRSDLLICNDTGPRHIAKAFDVAVVTIFGPTHPGRTATSYAAERIVRIDVECGPCQQRVCPLGHLDCMTGVSVDAVCSASRELLATYSGGTSKRRNVTTSKIQKVETSKSP